MEEVKVELVEAEVQNVTFEMFPNICRVCFGEENLQNIHLKYEEDMLSSADILLTFGISEIFENDQLPQNICEGCAEKLLELYLVVDLCRKSEFKLREILENANPSSQEHDYCDSSPRNQNEESNDNEIKSSKSKEGDNNEIVRVIEIHYEDGSDFGEVLQQFELSADDPIFEENDFETIKIQYQAEDAEHENNVDEESTENTEKNSVFTCEYCNASFSNASNFSRHKYVHLGDKPHKCDICDKSFTRRESLKIHMKYHTGEKHHVCNYCGKQFTTVSNYNRHILQHQLENGELTQEETKAVLETITCTYCNKMFSSKHALRTHMLLHQPKSFTCDVCGKKFTFQGNLKSHYRSHTGERPFQCEYCEKSFSFKSSLKEHIYIHTGERPHVCHYCKKGFAQHQHLKTHLRTHTGERPYSCNYCGKTFANKVNMTVHERIHTGTTPFICPICNKGFYDSSSLKKHRKRHEDSEEKEES